MVSRINFTRSKKMFFTGVLLISMFIAFILGSFIVKAKNNRNNLKGSLHYTNVVVKEGESLWNIAEEHLSGSSYDSVYEYMNSLKSVNGLTSNELYAGQNIIITYYE